MTQLTQAKPRVDWKRRLISILLFALSVILLLTSGAGYIVRGLESTDLQLNAMRTSAVMHAASGGLVNSIALQASADKLKELRSRKDFRSMGMDQIKQECADAEAEARAQAEALYSDTAAADTKLMETGIEALGVTLGKYHALEAQEKSRYAELYTQVFEGVADWTDFTGEMADDALFDAMTKLAPALAEAQNAHLKPSMLQMVRTLSGEEAAREQEEAYQQLFGGLSGAVGDWGSLADAADDDALWAALTAALDALNEQEAFRDRLLADAKAQIAAVQAGEAPAEAVAEETEELSEQTETVVDYRYFAESEALTALHADVDTAYEGLWTELTAVIPDLANLDKKMRGNIRDTIETIAFSGEMDFSQRFDIYAAQKADETLIGTDALLMKLAAYAERVLIGAIALLLLAIAYTFWKPIVARWGVPRTIILLFFIYLCLAAWLYDINVSFMLGNVLVRVGMYGVLALAMLPGIQCGIGLNMGMTLGCIAGLLSTVIALQYNMTGAMALAFSCVGGMLLAIPLGWAYAKLLNRMKGSEMTISTYVGFSFVSLMCIGWMLLPFTNTKIIWLLSGRGLRVTHSLLDSFAHLLDKFMAFKVLGIEIPTGLLLFFLACCGVMWLFSRSKLGIAMSAAGSNPRFAEASGINVDSMRTVGTVLSTVIAAVGIVIYSQAFGYAQLYTAPRQLGFIASSAILIGGATVSKAKVSHVIIGVFLFEGVLALGQQIANAAVAGGGLSEVMRIMISNGIILYALTQSGGASRD